MTAFKLYLVAISCSLFFVGSSSIIWLPPVTLPTVTTEEPMCSYSYTGSYGPCSLNIRQRSIPNPDGASIVLDLSVYPSSGSGSNCQVQKPDCPDYVYFEGTGGYYKYNTTKVTWYEAWQSCRSEGAHLSVFNSQEEAQFVGGLANGTSDFDWGFIGFHDMYVEGDYTTIFDQTLEEAGYNIWQPPNPNGGTRENCGVTFSNGALGDYICTDPRSFFCEISC